MPDKQVTILAAVGVLIIIGAIALFIIPSRSDAPTEDQAPVVNDNGLDTQDIAEPETIARYECVDGKTMTAGYSQAQVQVTLSDGREYTLEQTISASGARYANEGEEVVFWNKGKTAFVEEDGKVTYAECVEQTPATTENMMIDGTSPEEQDSDMIDGQVDGSLEVQ